MLALVLRNNLRAVDVKEVAAIGGAASGVSGFLFFVFRFLVGASVADMSADIKVLKSQMADMQASLHARDEKMDHLLQALVDNR